MEEFTVSMVYRIIFLGCILSFISLALYGFFGNHPKLNIGPLLLINAMVLCVILTLISRLIAKVIISTDSIINIGLFGRREIQTTDVKGFRSTGNGRGLIIESLRTTDRKIVINAVDQLGDYEDLMTWLKENFTDLDAEKRKKRN